MHLQSVIREQSGKPIRPLNGSDGGLGQIIFESDRFSFNVVLQSIKIDVNERKSTVVFMDKDKSRTADRGRRDSKSFSDPADHRSLAGAQVSNEGDRFPSKKRATDGLPDGFRFGTG